jgi:hypothetical protein
MSRYDSAKRRYQRTASTITSGETPCAGLARSRCNSAQAGHRRLHQSRPDGRLRARGGRRDRLDMGPRRRPGCHRLHLAAGPGRLSPAGSSFRVFAHLPDPQAGRNMEVTLDDCGRMISLEYGSPRAAPSSSPGSSIAPRPEEITVQLFEWAPHPRQRPHHRPGPARHRPLTWSITTSPEVAGLSSSVTSSNAARPALHSASHPRMGATPLPAIRGPARLRSASGRSQADPTHAANAHAVSLHAGHSGSARTPCHGAAPHNAASTSRQAQDLRCRAKRRG